MFAQTFPAPQLAYFGHRRLQWLAVLVRKSARTGPERL
jgi:hypothetical protein